MCDADADASSGFSDVVVAQVTAAAAAAVRTNKFSMHINMPRINELKSLLLCSSTNLRKNTRAHTHSPTPTYAIFGVYFGQKRLVGDVW